MKWYKLLLFCFLLVSCLWGGCSPTDQLIILHTNDTHSQVEPLDGNTKIGNKGGYVRRAELITRERANAKNTPVLLFDAGDFCQGTPYFNLYHGRLEVETMNRMGYDAATLGNHEFDNGIDTLAAILQSAKFPIVCANYKVEGTPLQDVIKPYIILKRKGLKIGVFGLGINPNGLIDKKNFSPLQYLDPVSVAQNISEKLRKQEHCDVVVCLSHLGFCYADTTLVSDEIIAQNTQYIDAIIGGHTHLWQMAKVPNAEGDSIPIVQMGKSGATVGRMVLTLK